MNVKKISFVVIALIVVLNLVGLIVMYCNINNRLDKYDIVEYTLFVGLNDKDTCRQEMPDDVAAATVRGILAKYVDGYTLMNAQGAWKDDSGRELNEKTIVCYLNIADETVVHSVADELIDALNQETIMIKRNLTSTEYYEGNTD